jgi:hypothetical protein
VKWETRRLVVPTAAELCEADIIKAWSCLSAGDVEAPCRSPPPTAIKLHGWMRPHPGSLFIELHLIKTLLFLPPLAGLGCRMHLSLPNITMTMWILIIYGKFHDIHRNLLVNNTIRMSKEVQARRPF